MTSRDRAVYWIQAAFFNALPYSEKDNAGKLAAQVVDDIIAAASEQGGWGQKHREGSGTPDSSYRFLRAATNISLGLTALAVASSIFAALALIVLRLVLMAIRR